MEQKPFSQEVFHMAEDKTLKKPKEDSSSTKLSVNYQGSGVFEGKSLQEASKDFPKGTKIKINGKTFTI